MDQQLLMKRILVVDDELDSNLALKLVREDNGFKADTFILLAIEKRGEEVSAQDEWSRII